MKNVRSKSALLGGAVALALSMGAQAQDEITYNSHVAQIINENCVVCHREGGIGPMQFENYDQVRPWAPLISYKVERREMPPYAYDQHIGIQDLEGDWRLDQDEIDTVVAWVQQGAPLGDPDIVPVAPELPDPNEWNFAPQFGQPDLIVESNS
ncbi:MAG: cytochrome c, partial [Pseudomonadales bacterium]|nr:cytochrome c [Pseudomonadales bacterium]